MKDTSIQKKIDKFIASYLKMKIRNKVINCPYWSNKIKNGKVTMRGYLNGKGGSDKIVQELRKRITKMNVGKGHLTSVFIKKFAKRENIGIDCSGLAYRIMEFLVKLGYSNRRIKKLSELFIGGIEKTSADILTNRKYSTEIDKMDKLRLGDLIRLMRGKHVLVVLETNDKEIVYIHSSHLTKTAGVHLGKIKIINKNLPLEKQNWLEKTKKGFNFGKKYFHRELGDKAVRLRIFS